MTAYLLLGLTLLVAYLIGGVPFGWLVARGRGVDILREGSGNIGATNVGRVLGRRFGALVFALDFAKGALPVLAAKYLAPFAGNDLPPDSLPVAAGVAAFLGHLFPVYLRFRGGKGVATGVGVVTVLLPELAPVVFAAWLVVLAASRYVSLASLVAVALLSVLRLTLYRAPFSWDHAVVTGFCLFGTALVFLRHAGNVRRLLQGSENRLKDSPAMLLFSKTIHVLALGLWFGTAVFFTVVGALLFFTFDQVSREDPRPIWLPLPADTDKSILTEEFVRKEQGSRVAGLAVRPLFAWYYGIQAGCALVAFLTALGWCFSRGGRRVHRLRAALLLAAALAVGVGWGLERVVTDLRGPRDELTDALFRSEEATDEVVARMEEARSTFVRWHGYSLLDNFAVLALVAVAMALTAQLPADAPRLADPVSDASEKRS